jgi:hypothetical protein
MRSALPLALGLALRALIPPLLLAASATAARAHAISLYAVDVAAAGREVRLRLESTPHELAPFLDRVESHEPLAAQLVARRGAVVREIAAYLTVIADGRAVCPPLLDGDLVVAEDRRVLVRLAFRCPRRPDLLVLRYDLFTKLGPGHRAVVTTHEPDPRPHLLGPGERTVTLAGEASLLGHIADFLVLGFEHIFAGHDHLLFLCALLLMAGAVGGNAGAGGGGGPPSGTPRRRALYLLAIVTSFTLAHSLTLILAATGVVNVPSRLVEPAIALTIAYVGLENLHVREARRRWLLTFCFGLVHGFGFAQILREIGLPRRGLLLSLLAFNLGVEAGQVAVLVLLFPAVCLLARGRIGPASLGAIALCTGLLLALLAAAGVRLGWRFPAILVLVVAAALSVPRLGYRAAVLRAGSSLILLLGLFWLVERVLGVSLLGGHLG